MKKYLLVLLLSITLIPLMPERSAAQKQDIEQLALDIQKLSQLKDILKDMKQAYAIVKTGYNKVRDVTQGNYSLHEAFIDGLLLVNPNIKNYARVADIVSYQTDILKEYKAAFSNFRASNLFNPDEINYLGSVYSNLFNQSLENLDELTLVLTANNLRMSDDERLQNIDRIYGEVKNELSFLRSFNRKTGDIMQRRLVMQQQSTAVKKIYGY